VGEISNDCHVFYEMGGMYPCRFRGQENILRPQLVYAGAFNLSLMLRKLLRPGMSWEMKQVDRNAAQDLTSPAYTA